MLGVKFIVSVALPNPAFKRDAAQARRPLTLRWALRYAEADF
jgi:hypothetical protein